MNVRAAVIAGLLLVGAAPPGIPGSEKPAPFDWPQWQGPGRDNRSREQGLLPAWPSAGPPLAWRVDGLGEGYSTPIIAAGSIFGLSYQGEEEVVWARDAAEGQPLWRTVIARANREVDFHQGSRGSVTVDGPLLYALGVSGDLVCLRVADGTFVWRKQLVRDFGGVLPFYRESYGYAESPLVDGGKVVVTPGGTKATIAALDQRNGDTIWTVLVPEEKKGFSSRAAYTSLVPGEVAGVRQYAQFLQDNLVGVSADGRLLWQWHKPSNYIANCSDPLFLGDRVFASSGYGQGCGLARIVKTGDRFEAKEVYFNKLMKTLHGGLVHVDGHVYGGSDPGMLVCLELGTGKRKWQERAAGKGSILYADGRLYYRDEKGPVLLVEATPAEYIERGRFTPPGRSKYDAWAHPVIANGRLYLRDQDVLLCYNVKKE